MSGALAPILLLSAARGVPAQAPGPRPAVVAPGDGHVTVAGGGTQTSYKVGSLSTGADEAARREATELCRLRFPPAASP